MAIPFGMYNLGNSGGSWMESVISSHPGCMCWEELRSTLNLPRPNNKEEDQANQKVILQFFHDQCESGQWQACGLIKGFRPLVAHYIRDSGGHFAQQCRNPIRHIHGTRKRAKQSVNGLGREPKDKHEYFLGRVLWQAKRYKLYLARSGEIPFFRLEDLSASLQGDGLYIEQALEWLTQAEWTQEDIRRILEHCPPRHRKGYPPMAWFGLDHESSEHTAAPWEKRPDPPPYAIWWEFWEKWQREIFIEHFQVIMLTLGYSVPGEL